MSTWKIGDVKITKVIESESPWEGKWLMPEATVERIQRHAGWLRPNFADERGRLILSIHAFVIESEGKRIVVDTCIGNDKKRSMPAWNLLSGPFLKDLAAAGYPRESIDRVICTHLHVDHVGWNTMLQGGKWVPTFPKARYLIGRKEWDFFSTVEDELMRDPVNDSVRPVIEAGLVDLVEPDARITKEVTLESTPGHTPGHISVRISSRGQTAVITGDLMHHPVQCAEPQWASGFDSDPDQARATRKAFVEKYGAEGALVFGTHFATPTSGRIVRDGSGWIFKGEANQAE